MSDQVGAPFPSVGAIQDALTGEILWVGQLGKDALHCISMRRVLRIPGMADGQPVAVRHISGRGDGIVIHVETSGSRRQLDSISPQGLDGDPGSDLADFLENVSGQTRSWPDAEAFVAGRTAPATSRLAACVQALELAASPPGDAAAVTERAIETLGELLDLVESSRGDLPRVAETLDRRRMNQR